MMRSFIHLRAALLILMVVLPLHSFAGDLFLRSDRVHCGDGRSIENGVIQIRDGRIVAVGADLVIPEGVTVIDLSGHHVTPGLIDANAKIEPENLLQPRAKTAAAQVRELFGFSAEPVQHFHDPRVCPESAGHEPDVICPICGGDGLEPEPHHDHDTISGVSGPSAISEQSSEVIPHTSHLDGLDLDSPDFERLMRDGVTTVYASPDPSAVLGARGAILRTAGHDRVLEPTAAVKAVIGSDPYRFGTRNRTPSRFGVNHFARRPQSRMGVGWIFRKAFYDAMLRASGGQPGGADTASPEASEVLNQVIDGEIALRVQARTSSDIESAYRLCGEFGVPFTLVDPVEAYRVLDLLGTRQVPIVFGPIYDRPTGLSARSPDTRRARLHTLRDLVEIGAPLCLSAQDLREEDGLGRQAMLAIRFGVDRETALELVTSGPAKILGIDGEVGTIESGKRADLVIWTGAPFAATSAVARVYVDGELSFERSPESPR